MDDEIVFSAQRRKRTNYGGADAGVPSSEEGGEGKESREGGMSVKPILFNTEMVRAILDGRKTVKRQVVKPRYGGSLEVYKDLAGTPRLCERCGTLNRGLRPPYQISDILYVRETWCRFDCSCCEGDTVTGRCLKAPDAREGCYMYRSTNEITGDARWRPSIHMPREAARIWLRVTDVRVERLQEINGNGLRAEGFDIPCLPNEVEDQFNKYGSIFDFEQAKKSFSALWNSTIKSENRERYGWAANPWVWVIEFERCDAPPQWGVQSATGQSPALSAEQKPEEG